MDGLPAKRKRRSLWTGYLGGAALTILVGRLLLLPVGDDLGRLSYDLPFLLSSGGVPGELVIVYLDSKVKADLGQPTDVPLDRRFHTELLLRLTQEGAKLILYDILFDQFSPDTNVDWEFAEAIRRHNRVVLVADYVQQRQGNLTLDSPIPPISPLAQAAAGWGLAKITPDPDFAIRQLDPGVEEYPSAGWLAASLLNATAIRKSESRLAPRWLNYYCAPDKLVVVNFDHALQADGLPKDYFRDKIVVVGSRPSVGSAGAEREEFLSPYSRFGGGFSSGPAIHSFALLNLLRGDWMTRLSPSLETLVIVFWGLLISAALMRLRPAWAAGAAVVGASFLGLLAAYLQMRQHVWFSWLTPAVAQTSVALVWSVGFQYTVERRRQRQLRKAFASYLSPYMAERIANSDFDLSLGGQEVEATVMFTDLEGFTKMSETLAPAEVSKILTTYFNQTTRFILQQNATIIKYMGDSVQVAWGVPWPEAKHAEQAVQAALDMNEACRLEVAGRRLHTRIGISTGLVLAGNLGSDFRFDYAVIGDTTNLASRLEGLNKYLGTDILISEFTQRQLSADIKLRAVGKFIVAGKAQPVGVYEVLGRTENFTPEPVWLSTFARALEKFGQREFDDAEVLLRRVIEQRGGKDGPAQFYLEEIQKTRARTNPAEAWDGTIRLASK